MGERLGDTRPDRLRPKDATDLFVLLAAADPDETAAVFQKYCAHKETAGSLLPIANLGS